MGLKSAGPRFKTVVESPVESFGKLRGLHVSGTHKQGLSQPD